MSLPHPLPESKKSSKKALWIALAFIWIVVLVCCVGGLIVASSSPEEVDINDPAVTSTARPSSPAATKAPTESAPAQQGLGSDGGWRLDSLNASEPYEGLFECTARVTNTKDSARTALLTVTILEGKRIVAVLNGAANEVEPGKTTTVQFVTSETAPGDFNVSKLKLYKVQIEAT